VQPSHDIPSSAIVIVGSFSLPQVAIEESIDKAAVKAALRTRVIQLDDLLNEIVEVVEAQGSLDLIQDHNRGANQDAIERRELGCDKELVGGISTVSIVHLIISRAPSRLDRNRSCSGVERISPCTRKDRDARSEQEPHELVLVASAKRPCRFDTSGG